MTQNWDVSRSDKSFTRPMRTVLIAGPQGMIAPSLLTAIQNELPWVRVEITADVNAACAQFTYPVALILLEPSLVEDAEASAELIRLCHPQAQVAEIMTESGAMRSRADPPGLVRSVLPMDIRLDLWLSVIQLMLSGGEYIPRNLMCPPPNWPPVRCSTNSPRASGRCSNWSPKGAKTRRSPRGSACQSTRSRSISTTSSPNSAPRTAPRLRPIGKCKSAATRGLRSDKLDDRSNAVRRCSWEQFTGHASPGTPDVRPLKTASARPLIRHSSRH